VNVLHIRQHREEPGFWQEIVRENPFSLLNFIGNTPLIEIHEMARHLKGAQIFAKAEWLNPGGSVKDRAGLRIIEEGERSGELTPDKIIWIPHRAIRGSPMR